MPPVRTKTERRSRNIPKKEDFTPEIERAIYTAIVETVVASRTAIAARPELASVAGNGGSELSKKILAYLRKSFGAEVVDGAMAARKAGEGKAAKAKKENGRARMVKAEKVKAESESEELMSE